VSSHLRREGSYSDRLSEDAKEAGLFTDVVEYTEANNVLDGIT